MQVSGEKVKSYMRSKIKYSNEQIEGRVVEDFLPRPESLVLRERKTRVTLTLTKNSVDFFKKAAKKHKAPYQAMIRRLIDFYVANQQA